MLPALGVLVLAILTRAKSISAPAVTVTEPVLLTRLVSVVPTGGTTVAAFSRLPEALLATCTWKLTVTVPPEGIVTEPAMAVVLATKLAVLAPALSAVATLVTVPRPAGKLSKKLAPVAVLGPPLLITKVKLSVPPATAVFVLATLVSARSTTGVTVTATVPVLFEGVVSVAPLGTLTLAAFTSVPLALPVTVAWKVTVTAPPEGIVTEPTTEPLLVTKLAVLAPALTWLVTLVSVPRPAGKLSLKLAPLAALGPAFVITRLKVTVPPALGVLVLAILAMARSTTGVTLTTAVPVPPVPVAVGGTLTAAVLVMLPTALLLT